MRPPILSSLSLATVLVESLSAFILIQAVAARQQQLPASMRLPCPVTDPDAVAALLSAASSSCPCDSASLCKPVTAQHEKEVFGFGAGLNTTWTNIDWQQVTTIAWSTDPQLVCLAHKHQARLSETQPLRPLSCTPSRNIARCCRPNAAVCALT